MIIHGVNPVREALRAHPGRIRYVAIARDRARKLSEIVDAAREAGVAVRLLPLDQVQRLARGAVHNGVVAEVSETAYADFDALVERPETQTLLLLDAVQDPQNFGAIVRVADVFGIDGVVFPEHESAGMTGAAVKASAGASEWVPVAQVTNLSRAIEQLKEREFWVYGADAEGDPVDSIDFSGKVAIVMGSEAKGIRRNVLEHCDRRIAIPMRGHVDSLNVSAAAAVICYEIDRQRRRKA